MDSIPRSPQKGFNPKCENITQSADIYHGFVVHYAFALMD